VRLIQRTELVSRRRPKLGLWLYVSSIQYFLIQILVAQQWSPPYSIAYDTISDLGNTTCGTFNRRFVCSPWHSLMNVSFLALGAAMIGGSLLLRHQYARSRTGTAGFSLLAVSGLGVVLVGIFPENSVPALHGIGAAAPFVLGNIAIIVLGGILPVPIVLRLYSFLSGAVALVALGCYATSHDLGLGEGGIERVVAYPQTIWLLIIGLDRLTRRSGKAVT